MPNGGVGPRAEAGAVTVIGLGGAGCRMLRAVQETAATNDRSSLFTAVAVDTDHSDLYHATPDDTLAIGLDTPDERWAADRDSVSYLTANDDFLVEGGVARSRAVGRYHADVPGNFDELYAGLEDALTDASADLASQEDDDGAGPVHQVWILNSLGGGTGSGLFPLVAAMVRDIAARLDAELLVGGIGSLPRLDALEDSVAVPAMQPTTHVNAYTALRELAVLLGHSDRDGPPLDLAVESDPEAIVSDAFTLEQSPFDVYGLVGATEEILGSGSYREQLNQAVADTVYTLAQQPVQPDHQGLDTFRPSVFGPVAGDAPRLFSIDTAGFAFPDEDLRRYLELGRDRAALDDQRRDLETELAELSAVTEYLAGVLTWDPGTGDDPPRDPAHLIESGRDVADRFDPLAGDDRSTLEAAVGDLESEVEWQGYVDAHAVAEYVLTELLSERLTDSMQSHPLPRRVEEVTAQLRPELEGYFEASLTDRPVECEHLLEFLADKRASLEEYDDDLLPFRIIERRRVSDRLERVRDLQLELRELQAEYDRLEAAHDLVEERRLTAEMQLRERRHTLEDRQGDARERRTELQSRHRRLEQKREVLGDRLRNGRRDYRHRTLPLGTLDSVDEQFLADADGLEPLVHQGLLASEDVAGAATHAFERVSELIQDLDPTPVDVETTTALALLSTDDNDAYLGHLLGDSEVAGRDAADLFEDLARAPITDPFSVRVLGLSAPIDLRNTSEFGVLHEYYADPDRELTAQFGERLTDADVAARFAYPELFPEDDPSVTTPDDDTGT